ncbi:Dual oxidase maturation factor 1 [Microtus ochrogaster]|uniref:Dual oxidase maturation factor 1 n=1 Tax=Microtus ochrogaster TaxID=79684 RepID=A0A8J6KL11_MICOH|nr:Dual oxidase maturation factor 1 [Microtus ochrogaster]
MAALGYTLPFYTGTKPAFPMDTALAVIITIFLTALVTFIIILPGIRGKTRLFWMLRVVTSLFIGAVILAVNFSSEWSVGQINTNTTYKAFSPKWVSVDVGLQIGLGGVNITLTDPVLYLAEKFTPQSPCGLYNQYRLAGHYASAMLWVAFLCWLLANVMLSMPVLIYGGHMLLATGLFQLLALFFFSMATSFISPCSLRLGTTVLHTHHGPAFWITLATAMAVAHRMQPHRLKAFFNQSAEDSVLEWGSEEGGLLSPRYRSTAEIPETQDIPMSEASSETCFKEEHIKPSDCAL